MSKAESGSGANGPVHHQNCFRTRRVGNVAMKMCKEELVAPLRVQKRRMIDQCWTGKPENRPNPLLVWPGSVSTAAREMRMFHEWYRSGTAISHLQRPPSSPMARYSTMRAARYRERLYEELQEK